MKKEEERQKEGETCDRTKRQKYRLHEGASESGIDFLLVPAVCLSWVSALSTFLLLFFASALLFILPLSLSLSLSLLPLQQRSFLLSRFKHLRRRSQVVQGGEEEDGEVLRRRKVKERETNLESKRTEKGRRHTHTHVMSAEAAASR